MHTHTHSHTLNGQINEQFTAKLKKLIKYLILFNSAQRTGFKPGDEAPQAYHDVFEYPKDYRPWAPNYKGNGIFAGAVFFSFTCKQKANRLILIHFSRE